MSDWIFQDEDRPYVAKQLNGHIIKTFVKCIYNYLHKDIHSNVEYFSKLSIDTAEEAQLTIIGSLMGVQKHLAVSQELDPKNVLFFYSKYVDALSREEPNGFGEDYVYDPMNYGIFTGDKLPDTAKVPMDINKYKAILKLISDYEYNVYSINFIIDLVIILLKDKKDFTVVVNTEYIDTFDITLSSDYTIFDEQVLTLVLNNTFKYVYQFNISREGE